MTDLRECAPVDLSALEASVDRVCETIGRLGTQSVALLTALKDAHAVLAEYREFVHPRCRIYNNGSDDRRCRTCRAADDAIANAEGL